MTCGKITKVKLKHNTLSQGSTTLILQMTPRHILWQNNGLTLLHIGGPMRQRNNRS
ncbi:hypothetical protein LINPERHAP1_LOCUS9177 [Linum perenne]